MLGDLAQSEAVLLILVGVALLLIVGPHIYGRLQGQDAPIEDDLSEEDDTDRESNLPNTSDADSLAPLRQSFDQLPRFSADTSTAPRGGPASPRYDDPMERVTDHHQYATSSGDIEHRFRSIRTDVVERQVMFAEPHDISDFLTPGALNKLFGNPELQYDLSIHIRPLDREETADNAKQRRNALKSVATGVFGDGDSDAEFEETSHEMARLKAYRKAIESDERPADITIVAGARGDDLQELKEQQAENIRKTLWRDPADISLLTAVGMQDEAIQSLAPIGKDPLGDNDAYTTEVLGLGVGALLGSMNRSTVIEENGVEWGVHAMNNSPIIKHPFKSKKNYNCSWIADSGSGKSYNAKRTLLNIAQQLDDTILIMQDPVQGFKGLAKAIGATEIEVGGNRGLNIMDIREPPEATLQSDDEDPGSSKIQEIIGIVKTYANLKDIRFDESQSTAEVAFRQAYERVGIDLDDPSTFNEDSPTIANEVYDILEDMVEDPEAYTVFSDGSGAEMIRDHAKHLANNLLRPFKEGSLENLGRESQFDIRDNDAIYLDLSRQDGVGSSSLMMQVLWSQVYERAKQTSKNVVLAIDEAEKLMQQDSNMQWFEDRVRRARHVSMATWFITQDINDFFKHPGAEVLLNNSHFKVYHNTSEIHEYRDRLGLTESQADFVKRANAGNGGYSNALYQFGERFVPARIETTPSEHRVIDFDPQEDEFEDLPGYDANESPLAAEIENRLRNGQHQATRIVDDGGPPAPGPWPGAENGLTTEQAEMLNLLSHKEMEDLLKRIDEEGLDPDTEIKRTMVAKTEQLSELLDLDTEPTNEVLNIFSNGHKQSTNGVKTGGEQ